MSDQGELKDGLRLLFMTNQEAFYKEVGQLLKKARKKRGLTQEVLASLVSLTRTSITNIEKGRQKLLLHTFVDIAKALKVSPIELLPDKELPAQTELDELLKGQPRKTQEWVKSTVKSVRKEE